MVDFFYSHIIRKRPNLLHAICVRFFFFLLFSFTIFVKLLFFSPAPFCQDYLLQLGGPFRSLEHAPGNEKKKNNGEARYGALRTAATVFPSSVKHFFFSSDGAFLSLFVSF